MCGDYRRRQLGLSVTVSVAIVLVLTLLSADYAVAAAASSKSTGAMLQFSGPPALLYFALVFLATALVISVLISFYLYRWRALLLRDGRALVPEELVLSLNGVADAVGAVQKHQRQVGEFIQRSGQHVSDAFSDIDRKVDELTQSYLSLQNALDEKDAELRRYREGHDSHVYRRFIARFLRVRQAIDDAKINDSVESKVLAQIERLLDDALADCGIERFEPPLGTDFRSAEGVADNPQTTRGAATEDEFKIVEVLEAGYRMVQGDRAEIVVPATVRINIR